MTSAFHDGNSLHRQELEKFLSGEQVDPNRLREAYHGTEDPRIRDLCRMLMKTTKVERVEDLAGEEGNLDGLLTRRNARILATKFQRKKAFPVQKEPMEKYGDATPSL